MKIKHFSISCALLFSSLNVMADSDNSAIEAPIYAMFDAMREHDGKKLLNQFTDAPLLHRAKVDGSINIGDLNKFADFVTSSDKYLDEHLLSVTTLKQDNLASVWTPYVFYLDKKLSHCGVNSFQLVLQEKEWKIQYLIDNTHQGDCEEFIKKHKK